MTTDFDPVLFVTYNIYSGGGPPTYMYFVVCYHMIVAQWVRSVDCVFAYIYIIVYELECPCTMDFFYLSRCFHESVF